jgi:hypothetical protein
MWTDKSGPRFIAGRWTDLYYQPYPYQYGYQPYYGYSQPESYGSYSYWNPSRYPGPRASGHGGY